MLPLKFTDISMRLILVLVLTSILSCKQDTTLSKAVSVSKSNKSATIRDAETKTMVQALERLLAEGDFKNQWHQNEKKAKYYESVLASNTNLDVPNKIKLKFQIGVEWLHAGSYDKSIEVFKDVLLMHENKELNLGQSTLNSFKELLAVSFLRKGEIENCVHHHNQHSCIIPIDPLAIHKNRKGSQQALKLYEELLDSDPQNLQNKWLYNLAQMTLGNYPNKVPKKYLLDASIFNSEYSLPAFEDVAFDAGVGENKISGGCIVDDFNGDGLLDIIASSYGLKDQLKMYINQGNGKFDEQSKEAGLEGIVSGLNMVQADFNNDGHLDFLILRGAWFGKAGEHPNSLIKNNGDGTFSDVTNSAGLYTLMPTQTASWGDFNNDGWIDLFIGNESSNAGVYASELFVNQKNGTFKEQAALHNINIQFFAKGCAWGDIDNDGNLDLYVSNLQGPNRLYRNLGPDSQYKFEDISNSSNVTFPVFSFPTWFWDFNNDGFDDILVGSFDMRDFTIASGKVAADYLNFDVETEYLKLYKNNGNNTFTDVASSTNIDKVLYTMGCNFEDIDRDGYLDFYASTGTPDFRAVFPNRMFRNDRGKSFQDVTTVTRTGHIQKGHGVGFGDIDNDGDQDMYVVLGGSYQGDNFMNALFKNPISTNNWISLTLEGTKANKFAIGTKVKISGIEANGKPLVIWRTVTSGASFGASSLRMEIGLSSLKVIDTLEVNWQGSDTKSVISNIEVNKHYRLTEGQIALQEIYLKSFEL